MEPKKKNEEIIEEESLQETPRKAGEREPLRESKSYGKKLVALGLSAILVIGALTLGGIDVFGRGKKTGPSKNACSGGVCQRVVTTPKSKPVYKSQKRQEVKPEAEGHKQNKFKTLLGEDKLKEVVEKQLNVTKNEIKYKSIKLTKNTASTDPASSKDQEKNKVTKNIKDKLVYRVILETKNKVMELRIGAKTGTVYQSQETKANLNN